MATTHWVVFDALFGSGSSDILFRPAADDDLLGQAVTMRDIQRCAAGYGEIAIGIRRQTDLQHGPSGGVYLNPPQEQRWSCSATDEVVVFT